MRVEQFVLLKASEKYSRKQVPRVSGCNTWIHCGESGMPGQACRGRSREALVALCNASSCSTGQARPTAGTCRTKGASTHSQNPAFSWITVTLVENCGTRDSDIVSRRFCAVCVACVTPALKHRFEYPADFKARDHIAVAIAFHRLAGWKACPTGSGWSGIGNYFRQPLYMCMPELSTRVRSADCASGARMLRNATHLRTTKRTYISMIFSHFPRMPRFGVAKRYAGSKPTRNLGQYHE